MCELQHPCAVQWDWEGAQNIQGQSLGVCCRERVCVLACDGWQPPETVDIIADTKQQFEIILQKLNHIEKYLKPKRREK